MFNQLNLRKSIPLAIEIKLLVCARYAEYANVGGNKIAGYGQICLHLD
jgi:hypothetical protein